MIKNRKKNYDNNLHTCTFVYYKNFLLFLTKPAFYEKKTLLFFISR